MPTALCRTTGTKRLAGKVIGRESVLTGGGLTLPKALPLMMLLQWGRPFLSAIGDVVTSKSIPPNERRGHG